MATAKQEAKQQSTTAKLEGKRQDDLTKAIEQAKEAGGEDELEALKSLGYLGD